MRQSNERKSIPIKQTYAAGKHFKKWNFDLIRKILKFCKHTSEGCSFSSHKQSLQEHCKGGENGERKGCEIKVFEISRKGENESMNDEDDWSWYPNK